MTVRDDRLNIRCGDDLRDLLESAGVGGSYLKWCDPVCDGPTPDLEGEAWYTLRARFITERYGEILASVYGDLVGQDRALEQAHAYKEIVLWFEHDLFDQAILVRLLAWFADNPVQRLSLIQSDRHLSELKPRELSMLFSARQRVGEAELAFGRMAWQAWRQSSPTALSLLLERADVPLPHFCDAVRRHFQEFPGRDDGLSHTERLAMLAIADGARGSPEIFRWVQRAEAADWLGDTMFWPVLDDLAHARMPLIRLVEGGWTLTPAGASVLSGKLDATQFNGMDRWRGGVHLQGRGDWRWDGAKGGRLVAL